ncbi:MAG: hypothetical protein DLM70_00460, partial [Chloroflexi bacterium]
MVVADEQGLQRGTILEVASSWPAPFPAAAEIEGLGLHLLAHTNLLRLDGFADSAGVEKFSVLFNPLVETLSATRPVSHGGLRGSVLDVFCHDAVTDVEGETASLALTYAGFPSAKCRAGRRYRFSELIDERSRATVEHAVGNPLIHRFSWWGQDSAPLHERAAGTDWVERIRLPSSDEKL